MALNFPANPSDGDTYESYVWNATVNAWQAQAAEGGGSIEVSSTAPANPSAGDLWWDPDNGNLYIYYNDGTTGQWVAANGPQVFVGTSAPAGYQGQLWFDSTEGKTYIYYDDGTSGQWVSAIGGSLAGSVLQVVSTTKVDTFTTTSSSFVDVTGLSASITPSSTSSKILCFVDVNLVASNNEIPSIQLVRGATAIGGGTAAGSRYSAFSAQYTATTLGSGMIGGSFLDSPNTTSSTTYKVQTLIRNAGSVTVNAMSNDLNASVHPRLSSTITLMEIAG